MRDAFAFNEIIPTRAVVTLDDGTPVVAGDCDGVSLYVYDLSSSYPEDSIYTIADGAASDFFGGTYSDGVYTYNFEHKIAASGTFTRTPGHLYRLRYLIATTDEGTVTVDHLIDVNY